MSQLAIRLRSDPEAAGWRKWKLFTRCADRAERKAGERRKPSCRFHMDSLWGWSGSNGTMTMTRLFSSIRAIFARDLWLGYAQVLNLFPAPSRLAGQPHRSEAEALACRWQV